MGMTPAAQEAHAAPTQSQCQHRHRQSRNVTLLTRATIFCLNACAAFLHHLLRPLGLEPAASAFVRGSLFVLFLVPVGAAFLLIESVRLVLPGWYDAVAPLRWKLFAAFAAAYAADAAFDRASTDVSGPASWKPNEHALGGSARAFWYAWMDYFPMTLKPWSENARLPPDRQYVFAVHPHGIHCLPQALFNAGTPFDDRFPGLCPEKVHCLVASVMFYVPVVREIMHMVGAIDARREVAGAALAAGKSVQVCVGGEEESLLSRPGEDALVLSRRKGFVRLALSHGVDIVPVLGLGVTDVYSTYSFLGETRRRIQKRFKIALPLFHGRMGTPLPYRKKVEVLIGEPIRTPVPDNLGKRPEATLVDEYHAKYVEALTALHAKHAKGRKLIIL